MASIPIQQVLNEIDQGVHPFKIQFAKSDGTLREMICLKRNKSKAADKRTSHEKSAFKYRLSQKHALILDELIVPNTTKIVRGLGTVQRINGDVRYKTMDYKKISRRPKTVTIFSLRMYNDKMIHTIGR